MRVTHCSSDFPVTFGFQTKRVRFASHESAHTLQKTLSDPDAHNTFLAPPPHHTLALPPATSSLRNSTHHVLQRQLQGLPLRRLQLHLREGPCCWLRVRRQVHVRQYLQVRRRLLRMRQVKAKNILLGDCNDKDNSIF